MRQGMRQLGARKMTAILCVSAAGYSILKCVVSAGSEPRSTNPGQDGRRRKRENGEAERPSAETPWPQHAAI
jgi:hypothetical protein